MRKQLMLCLIWLFYLTSSIAQSDSPSALVPAGDENKTENISLEWTIGEVFSYTLNHEKGILTQGFHQPILEVELPENVDLASGSNLNILAYPNPVLQTLTIDISSEDENRDLAIELFDLNGKKLVETISNTADDLLKINMGSFPSGLYLLRFNDEQGRLLQTYQIMKVNE